MILGSFVIDVNRSELDCLVINLRTIKKKKKNQGKGVRDWRLVHPTSSPSRSEAQMGKVTPKSPGSV